MKGIIREIIAILLCAVIVFAISAYAGYIYNPARTSYGALWNMYKCEDEDSVDVMFVGSSLTYCDIIPAEIYQQTGHTSYVLGGPNLTLPLSYYYVKEGLKTQDPEILFVEVSSLFFKKYEDDTKSSVGFMPYNFNRLGAIFNGVPKEERLGLIFPLYNLHDKWDEISLKAFFKKRDDAKADINAGYTYLDISRPVEQRSELPREVIPENFDYASKYLRKIKALCDKKGIEMYMLIVPETYYFSEEKINLIRDNFGDIPLADFTNGDIYETIGLDLQNDYYDNMHLNFSGAEKFSVIIGDFINEKCTSEVKDHDKKLWDERVKHYGELQKLYAQ